MIRNLCLIKIERQQWPIVVKVLKPRSYQIGLHNIAGSYQANVMRNGIFSHRTICDKSDHSKEILRQAIRKKASQETIRPGLLTGGSSAIAGG